MTRRHKTQPTESILRLALQPRHWPVGAGFVVLRFVILLPFPVLVWAGRWIGRLMYRLAKQRRHVAETNIGLCFPRLTRAEIDILVKKNFESAGIAIFETPLSWWGNTSRLKSLAHIHGMEHINKAKADGRGILLLGAHFTCVEIGATLLSLHEPTVNMYKKHHNALFEAVMRKNRGKHTAGLVQRHDVRAFIRELNQGKICWIAPDQDFGDRNSVFAPFMGVPAATATATARMAKMSNAIVIPFFSTRRTDASGYDLDILPPLENFPTGDDVEDATRINQVIADHVKKTPEQYLWLHRRFKTRPEGQARPY